MGLRSWWLERKRKKVTSDGLDALYAVIMEHLENGGQIEDLTAYVVENDVWWSQKDQTWKITCETSTLGIGDRVYLSAGRGGADEFANVSGASVGRGVLEFEYPIEFGENSRAGLGSGSGSGSGGLGVF